MSNKTPAYVAVCNRIMEFARAERIELVPQAQVIDGFGGNKGWACFQVKGTEHKLYVPRGQDRVGALHTTAVVPEGTPGKVPHVRTSDGKDLRPGKIESFFSSDPSTLVTVLSLWAGTPDRLRASKAPTRRAASQAPAAATPAVRTGTPEDIGA